MSKSDGMFKEIDDSLKFIKVANETIRKKGKIYKFKCPLCGNEAEGIKNTYNGHLWAKCKNCNMQIIE